MQELNSFIINCHCKDPHHFLMYNNNGMFEVLLFNIYPSLNFSYKHPIRNFIERCKNIFNREIPFVVDIIDENVDDIDDKFLIGIDIQTINKIKDFLPELEMDDDGVFILPLKFLTWNHIFNYFFKGHIHDSFLFIYKSEYGKCVQILNGTMGMVDINESLCWNKLKSKNEKV